MNSVDAKYIRNTTLAVTVLFQSKWRVQILCAMRSGPVRLGQLARLIPGASKKMLTQNLRQLEADGIVVRKDMSDLVLHIEYDLTHQTRESVCALLDYLAAWGRDHLVESLGAEGEFLDTLGTGVLGAQPASGGRKEAG
jgi:DNA-binding HxlR family transcriptional regulator